MCLVSFGLVFFYVNKKFIKLKYVIHRRWFGRNEFLLCIYLSKYCVLFTFILCMCVQVLFFVYAFILTKKHRLEWRRWWSYFFLQKKIFTREERYIFLLSHLCKWEKHPIHEFIKKGFTSFLSHSGAD